LLVVDGGHDVSFLCWLSRDATPNHGALRKDAL
jgi:hypothetical protein